MKFGSAFPFARRACEFGVLVGMSLAFPFMGCVGGQISDDADELGEDTASDQAGGAQGGNPQGETPSGGGGEAGERLDADVPAAPDAGDSTTPQPSDGSTEPTGPIEMPPSGAVPMFVAAGHGGRTITSCDDGRTWTANHALESGNNDHSPYTHKGLAYGQGTFMEIMGWGAGVSLKVSDDGVTWRRETNLNTNGFYGGIAHGGGVFAMLRQGVTQMSNNAGVSWTRATTQPRGDFREGGGGGDAQRGVFAGGGSGQAPWMSWDSGRTWRAASGCGAMDFGGIGQVGGMAYGNGVLLIVAENGKTCRINNNGDTTETGSLGASINGKLFWVGDRFWVMTGNKAHRSADGKTWETLSLQPTTVAIHSIARSDAGTYVGIDRSGSRFYRSSDGVAWQAATGTSGNQLLRVVFGYGKASAACPGATN